MPLHHQSILTYGQIYLLSIAIITISSIALKTYSKYVNPIFTSERYFIHLTLSLIQLLLTTVHYLLARKYIKVGLTFAYV